MKFLDEDVKKVHKDKLERLRHTAAHFQDEEK
jgi:hypothetical protein